MRERRKSGWLSSPPADTAHADHAADLAEQHQRATSDTVRHERTGDRASKRGDRVDKVERENSILISNAGLSEEDRQEVGDETVACGYLQSVAGCRVLVSTRTHQTAVHQR